MRVLLTALLFALPLTACDPDAAADTEATPTETTVPVDPAPAAEDAPGDTGLPDTLQSDIGADALDPAEV
ncbi:MAG: hypothetical protein AAFQ43_06595, partial [Bacteroidota bacterium]